MAVIFQADKGTGVVAVSFAWVSEAGFGATGV